MNKNQQTNLPPNEPNSNSLTYLPPLSLSTSSSNSNNITHQTTSPATLEMSYSAAATEKQTKENAIVLPAIENIEIYEYVEAVGELIKPENITHAFKISGERICIYFIKKSQVTYFVNNFPTIKIQNKIIPTRRLISPGKKLIISGVHPIISNNKLELALKERNINLLSNITDIRIYTTNPKLQHVKSARKIVYVKLEDNIPPTLEIDAGGEMHRIFLNPEEDKCKFCDSKTHSSSRCSQKNLPVQQPRANVEEIPISSQLSQQPHFSTIQTEAIVHSVPPQKTIKPTQTSVAEDREAQILEDTMKMETEKISFKRLHSITNSEDSITSQEVQEVVQISTKTPSTDTNPDVFTPPTSTSITKTRGKKRRKKVTDQERD